MQFAWAKGIFGVISCAHLAGVRFQDVPINGPHIKWIASFEPQSTLDELIAAQKPMERTLEGLWCEQGVPLATFDFFTSPLGEQRMQPSEAPQVEAKRVFKGYWCRGEVCKRIRRLPNPSRRFSILFVGNGSKLVIFILPLCHLLAVMMSGGDSVRLSCSQLTSLPRSFMQVTHLVVQHILGPARHSCCSRHATFILWVIWVNSNYGLTCGPHHIQIQVHLIDAQKGMLDS